VKQIEVTAYDDLDRVEKDTRTRADVEVHLGLDGEWLVLDLTQAHEDELRRVLARYLAAGSRPDKPPVPRRSRAVDNPRTRRQAWNGRVREWARLEHIEIPGSKISLATRARYVAVHPGDPEPAVATQVVAHA
jgi:hypothetical protein